MAALKIRDLQESLAAPSRRNPTLSRRKSKPVRLLYALLTLAMLLLVGRWLLIALPALSEWYAHWAALHPVRDTFILLYLFLGAAAAVDLHYDIRKQPLRKRILFLIGGILLAPLTVYLWWREDVRKYAY